MAAYLPSSWLVPAIVLALVGSVVIGGRLLTRHTPLSVVRVAGWSGLVVGSAALERSLTSQPPGVRMLSLIAFAMVMLKALVLAEARVRGVPLLGFWRFVAFTLAWPGMRPDLFVPGTRVVPRETLALLRRGAFALVLGTATLLVARDAGLAACPLLTTPLLLFGVSLVVHFGLLNVLAAGFRSAGIACEGLFRAPWQSESLSEFWSRRWNVAFSEMTALVVYRPLSERFGRSAALLSGFALSGLLHELAISVPVRDGFGRPFVYFALQALAVSLERHQRRVGRPLRGWKGRAWTFAWLLMPLPLLFHAPFVEGVLRPPLGLAH